MLTEIGAKFGLQGVEVAIQQMAQLKGSFSGLSQTVQQHTAVTSRHTEIMAHSVSRMAQSIRSSMNIAKAAFAAFLTGRAFEGVVNWMQSDAAAGLGKDFLRYHGASEANIKAMEHQVHELEGKVPGFSPGEYFSKRGMFTIQSAHSHQGVKQMQEVGESMAYLSKVMDASFGEATDYYKTLYYAFAQGLDAEQKAAFHKKVLAGTSTALSKSGVLPEDLKEAMGFVGPIYAAMGKSIEDLLTDVSILAPALGGGEKAGTALRNLTTTGGTSYGSLRAYLAQRMFEKKEGTELEAMPDKLQHAWRKAAKIIERTHQEKAGEWIKTDPERFYKNFSEVMERIKALGGDFMGEMMKHGLERRTIAGALALSEAYAKGERQKLRKEFEAGSDEEIKKRIEERSISFASQYKLFEQKLHGLGVAIRKVVEPFTIPIMQKWGDQINRITEAWERNTAEIVANARLFFGSFGEAFAQSFGGLPDIEAGVKRLVDTLASADPEKWKQLGAEWGSWAGADIKGFVADLQEMGSAFHFIADAVRSLKEELAGIGALLKPIIDLQATKKEQVVLPGGMFTADKGSVADSVGRWFSGETPTEVWETLRGVPSVAQERAKLIAPPRPGGSPVAPQLNVESKPTLNVRIGDHEIIDIVIDAVLERFNMERNREGLGWAEATP